AAMPDFSPDGSRIVYIDQRGTAPSAVWTAAADGGQRRQITRPRWLPGDFGPSWSPDGRWIAVWRDVRGQLPPSGRAGNHLIVMHPDGSDAHTVLTLHRPFDTLAQVDWSPNGRQLVVQQIGPGFQDGRLAVLPATGGKTRIVTAFSVWSARWSPD